MKILKYSGILITFCLFFSANHLLGQDNPATADTSQSAFEFIKDDFIAASLDSLAGLRYFEGFECPTDETLKNVFGFTPGFVPVYADSVYYNRLKKLDAASPINLTYNQYVKDYIELYAVKKRGLMERVMGLAQIYFPMFEEHLDRFNMPLELKYLAIVESALNPVAKSRVGATGLWQFMYGTGKAYNLKVTSLVDDRRDPLKSTIAACEHMNDLYKMYNDWLLVLAAYNSGAGNVNKAIRRSGGKMDFWQIRPFLPLETRGYVPAFIAVNYVMSYAAEHNLRPVQPLFHHFEIDTVIVKDVLSFNQISTLLNIPVEEIEFLNPAYKSRIIPATKENTYVLRLQKKNIADFVNNEAQLYAYRSQAEIEKEQVLAMMKTVTQAEYHKVKRGESLGVIARKYRCSVNDLKRWNRLRSTNIQIGQRLIVRPESFEQVTYAQAKPKPAPAQKTDVRSASAQEKESNNNSAEAVAAITAADSAGAEPEVIVRRENIYHRVKRGETLGRIAGKYKTSISELQRLNNLRGSNIQAGARLIVGISETTDTVGEAITANHQKTKENNTVFKYYTVQRGDTLWKIANQHEGVTVEDIKRLNNITNEKQLRPGQKIKVTVIS